MNSAVHATKSALPKESLRDLSGPYSDTLVQNCDQLAHYPQGQLLQNLLSTLRLTFQGPDTLCPLGDQGRTGKVPQNNFILKGKTISFFQRVKICLGGPLTAGDTVFSPNQYILISNLPPSCCTNTHSWSHWKQRIAHASIHMHRCFRYFCIHLIINSFKKAFPQVQAFTTVLSGPLTELTDPFTDPHNELNDLLVPGQKASQHVY